MWNLLLISISLSISGMSSFHGLAPSDHNGFMYDLDNYDHIVNLPSKLMEISGLSYHSSSGQLLAVNDEKGHFYFVDIESGDITRDVDFGKKGDYEGIELVGDVVYVVKNNGNLYGYNLKNEESLEVIKAPLSPSNDVEGLAYDSKTNALILACKGNSSLTKIEIIKDKKSFYSFSLANNTFDESPVLTFTDASLVECWQEMGNGAELSKKKREKRIKRIEKYSPSAIAIHPITKDIYSISSVGNTLVIADSNGTLKSVHHLDGDIHRQPEGLTFDNQGNMYISNEGRGLVAKIYRYDMKKA